MSTRAKSTKRNTRAKNTKKGSKGKSTKRNTKAKSTIRNKGRSTEGNTRSKSTKRNTKAKSMKRSKGRSTEGNTRSKSTKKVTNRSTKATDSDAKKGGTLKGGTELGIEKGDSTVGRIRIGGEAGLESDYSSGEFREGAEDVFDSIKSGIKAAKKKIADIYD